MKRTPKGRPFIGDRKLYERFAALHPDSPRVAEYNRGGSMFVTARRCYRRNNPSGGVLLTAVLSPKRKTYQRDPFERHLGPGWTEKAFVQATRTLFYRLICEMRRMDWASMVEDAATGLSDAVLAEIEAEEIRLGKISDYTEMEIEDAQHWLKWLAAHGHRSARMERSVQDADAHGYASEDAAYTNYPRLKVMP